jgi:hypothetical protein
MTSYYWSTQSGPPHPRGCFQKHYFPQGSHINTSALVPQKIKVAMFCCVLVLVLIFAPMASALMLTCDQPCPDTPITCECLGAVVTLIWGVNGSRLFPRNFRGDDVHGTMYSANGFTAVLYNTSGTH